jgi:hypothetical protein
MNLKIETLMEVVKEDVNLTVENLMVVKRDGFVEESFGEQFHSIIQLSRQLLKRHLGEVIL